ncbi:MAG: malate synthase G [SAR86 cluster bacterium BACL1 MAG-120820-bin45]|jgi:malate synthase|uniref:Malate synthase G n=1 Tax=SAR86 cluster bacterium BACL1 MAG-120820-bin45 TaxID=1655612 RepID=A0A0R2U639_9GAMM|nr:MAG: malate synthase G [SAR86 cluster bacterium BACL1 MAG-120507-bin14]KRO95041.1 MAG: malate synthase G [SAR86 cluster bacterium BACL1 MAG-120820-bin45]
MALFLFQLRESLVSNNYISKGSLSVSDKLANFVSDELLPGLAITPENFWDQLETIIHTFAPKNKELLAKRESIQGQIDQWHLANKDQPFNLELYKTFLKDIDYIVEEGGDFHITTQNVDPEIAMIAGPQLVVPVMNARFALNAANARWGSLYDALYGTDMIGEEDGASRAGAYNPIRGDKVIAFAKAFLDKHFPLKNASFNQVTSLIIEDGSLIARLENGSNTALMNADQFQGFQGTLQEPSGILLRNNNLHAEIQVDPTHSIGASDLAGIKDVLLESAITTIQDCEDSVAAVDGEDKVQVYRNWLGLMKGDLKETFMKAGLEMTRHLNPDRVYQGADGSSFALPGRSLMLVRNVGHLMTNPAILDSDGQEIPEGILDAMFTICIAMHDLNGNSSVQNSKAGSIYIVKPKMHGPEEVQFTCDLFSAVEQALGLTQLTAKVGIMDEERRTTVNLKECIRAAQDRVIFINTGFLDRTGDEIHTSMEAGPMIRKAEMKQQPWILAYEDWNVDSGLETGFKGHAQIGKGMWPMPDEMLNMYNIKLMHPKAGANCAWVPSPTGATLHAMHYHQILVSDQQEKLISRTKASLDDILTIPLLPNPSALSAVDIQRELDNNAQGILGYVVRWIDHGIGCSKVPDINNIGLMEDRATCRISSQHIANWLHHSLCSEEQVIETMQRMAVIVDEQNSGDPQYQPMAPLFTGTAFQAACNLATQGRSQPSGYTEPILHQMRLKFKAQ